MLMFLVQFRCALSQRERGATAAQYGIVVALIAAAVIVVVAAFGEHFRDAYQYLVKGLPGGA